MISNIIKTFRDTAISRRIVNVKHENFTENFLRLGLNLIVDKIWFVELPEADVQYAYETIGYAEGKSIALSETKMVIEAILGKADTDENRFSFTQQLNENHLKETIPLLRKREFDCDVILTNLSDVLKFWEFESFEGAYKPTSPFGLEGHYQKIPVYWSNFIAKGRTLLINKDVGDLFVKKDISADILEIKQDEVASVLESVPGLDRKKLEEKVRFLADEVIRFQFNCEEAVVVVESLPNEKV